ncbi:glycosyltransferase family 1 protein [Candidatus Microgenomates bacterium]|nr:MAG: glycosyltransferase family 1 protein [Candidatus Microgenomates bacterium]
MSALSLEQRYFNLPEHIHSPEPTLPPGAQILYVCDSTDGNSNGGMISGVKRTQLALEKVLKRMGYLVTVAHSQMQDSQNGQAYFRSATVPFQGQRDFKAAINVGKIGKLIREIQPDGVFVATLEGPLGLAAALFSSFPKLIGLESRIPYIASYTSRFHDQVAMSVNRKLGLNLLDNNQLAHFIPVLYRAAHRILVPTKTMEEELKKLGYRDMQNRAVLWPRGVDSQEWHPPKPQEQNPYTEYDWFKAHPELPIILYFGRVAAEKNIETYLNASLPPCHLVIIGDGSIREDLEREYSRVHFLGTHYNEGLAAYVRFASVHMFPSTTDTFGNSIVEAGASGVPTIGFKNAAGPKDIITTPERGFLINDLTEIPAAIAHCLNINPQDCATSYMNEYSWRTAAETLLLHLPPTPFWSQRHAT